MKHSRLPHHMYEQFLQRFRFISSDTPYCAIELYEPYLGVQLYIGKEFAFSDVGGDTNSVTFDYEIFSQPEGSTFDFATAGFDELMKNIFLAILEKKMGR